MMYMEAKNYYYFSIWVFWEVKGHSGLMEFPLVLGLTSF